MTECPIVETSLGKVKGKVIAKVEDGKEVFLYTSVPFAKPPIGELRFEPPVSPEPWDGVRDATKHSAAPVQDITMAEDLLKYFPAVVGEEPIYDEDCLYLSVYTSNPSKSENLPVLFWIYGGGFSIGGEAFYGARAIASLHDVVVVVPNYRLSILGFLSLGKDSEYPGNVGLLDQNMAMKWTQSHIRAFGGNPDNVTISGESAGGMSVSYHVVSPLSKGLFHQAISHSGTFYANGFPMESAAKPLAAFLEQLKITEKDPQAQIKKLKSISTAKLVNATKVLGDSFVFFGPVSDGKFFPKDLAIMRKDTVANNVPYIVGCNSTEGHGLMTAKYPKGFKSGITKESYETMVKNFIGGSFLIGLPDSGYDVIKKEYAKKQLDDDKMKWSKMYGEVLADTVFINPTIKALKKHVESKGKTYMYVMTQQPKFHHDSAYGPESARKASFCECDHGDDLIFTYGMPLIDEKFTIDLKFTEDEKALSREWMKYIVNFATNGDPNAGIPVKVKWPEYDAENREYLSVQQPCSLGKNFGESTLKFWSEVVEPILNTSVNQSSSGTKF